MAASRDAILLFLIAHQLQYSPLLIYCSKRW